MKLTEEVKQKVQSLKRKFGNNCVIIYQKDADALFAIIDDWLSAVPETEALTDEQMRLMAHEVIDFNGGITDGVINMLQRHFSRRPAPAPEPAPQQDDADVKEAKAQLVSCMMDAYFEASREPYSYPPNKVKGMTAALDIVLHKSCGFYDALDKHVRNGVIAAAVDIGRHHQELIRMSEKEAYADTTGEISPQEKASQ